MFISFDKSHLEKYYKPDVLEQVGNFLRFPVNRGIGSQVKIISLKSGHIFLSKKIISLCKRIACIALCVLLAPVCLLATLVGTLAIDFLILIKGLSPFSFGIKICVSKWKKR